MVDYSKLNSVKPMITIGVKWIDLPNAVNIYCGQGSPLGNPFATKSMSLKERDDVCDRFEIYLKEQANIKNSPQRNEMLRIRKLFLAGNNINLQCYCTPKRCHCESIRDMVLGSIKK